MPERQKYLKRIHRWITASFVINLLVTIVTLLPFISAIYLRFTNITSDNLFPNTILWFTLSHFTIPIGDITSLVIYLTLREWRKLKLPNQNYTFAYIGIILGLLPSICMVTVLCIALIVKFTST